MEEYTLLYIARYAGLCGGRVGGRGRFASRSSSLGSSPADPGREEGAGGILDCRAVANCSALRMAAFRAKSFDIRPDLGLLMGVSICSLPLSVSVRRGGMKSDLGVDRGREGPAPGDDDASSISASTSGAGCRAVAAYCLIDLYPTPALRADAGIRPENDMLWKIMRQWMDGWICSKMDEMGERKIIGGEWRNLIYYVIS
jgi:hypothetical protein